MTSIALASARTFRSLRRHHNYRLFFAGQVVSLAGSWMQIVALAWLVIDLGGSPFSVGALAFARFVPFTVLGLVAGVITDRVDTRRLLIATQAAAMVLAVALAAISFAGVASIPLVYVLATLGGVVFVLDAPARQAFTFEMVGPRELPNAVALNTSLFNATRVVGPALAGGLIAVAGTGWCFAANAVSFLAVLAALVAMRPDELVTVERDPANGIARDLTAAFRWIAGDPTARTVVIAIAAFSLVGFNFHVLVPLLAAGQLHTGPGGLGLLSSAFGVGALAGAIVAAGAQRASTGRFVGAAATFGALLMLLAFADSPVTAGIVLTALGAAFALVATTANALVQLAAPQPLRGRVITLYLYAFVGLTPLGGLLVGALADRAGTGVAFGLAGMVCGTTSLWCAKTLGRRSTI